MAGGLSHGYGITGPKSVDRRAHRASYQAFRGPIPRGLFVCHRCDTPSCVNPDHLFLGTVYDNNADRKAKGRARGEWGRNRITEREALRALQAVDVPAGEMARELGVARSTIASIRNGSTWGHLPRPKGRNPRNARRGEGVTVSKLTEAQVLEIRRRRAAGERGVDLAREFGIGVTYCRRLANGEYWSYLNETGSSRK